MTWLHPRWLLLLPLVLGGVVVAETALARRRSRLRKALREVAPGGVEQVRSWLVGAALSLVVVALATPVLSSAGEKGGGEGVTDEARAESGDVLLVLDVSRSMSTRDVAPSRGQVARMAALRVATGAPAARVGVAAFAADAYLLVPPTEDRGLVTLYVESLDPDAVSGQGSDLARALDVAVSTLTGQGPSATAGMLEEGRTGAVVLLSDGEGFQDDQALEDVLRRARGSGVVVHTVWAGTEAGGEVPGSLRGGRSSARPQTMAHIAQATGGRGVDARDGPGVAGLVEELARGSHGGGAPTSGTSLIPLLALAAVALLLAESALGALPVGRTP